MGSFAATCVLSGLPIRENEPVYLIILRSSLIDPTTIGTPNQVIYNKHMIAADALWEPAAFPIAGLYNDYGFISNYTKDYNTELVEKFFSVKIDELRYTLTQYNSFESPESPEDKIFQHFSYCLCKQSVYQYFIEYSSEANTKLPKNYTVVPTDYYGYQIVSDLKSIDIYQDKYVETGDQFYSEFTQRSLQSLKSSLYGFQSGFGRKYTNSPYSEDLYVIDYGQLVIDNIITNREFSLEIIRKIYEMWYVNSHLGLIGRFWHGFSSIGSQYGELKIQEDFYKFFIDQLQTMLKSEIE